MQSGDNPLLTISGLNPGTTYTFKMEAVDRIGNWSTTGPSIIVTTSEQPLCSEIRYPPSAAAYILDVTQAPYNAKGDGITDDTQALQAAITAARSGGASRLVYVPNGTYLVSNTLQVSPSEGSSKRVIFQGECEKETILQLIDNAPGYDNPSNPKWVYRTADDAAACAAANSFAHYIKNLTIDVGRGNPGANAIFWYVHNTGAINSVTLRGLYSGNVAIDLYSACSGPGFVKHLTVEGFEKGIQARNTSRSMTFYDINLSNQRQYGILNDRNILTFRKLNYTGNVPLALNTDGTTQDIGMLNLIDVTINGTTGASGPAIINNRGYLFARNIQSAGGFSTTIQNNTGVGGSVYGDVTEFVSHRKFSLFSETETSLNLPFLDVPEVEWEMDFSKWANVLDYGAIPGDGKDDGPSVQAALNDPTKTVVYFPYSKNTYEFGSSVVPGPSISQILGTNTQITYLDNLVGQGNPAIFRFEDNTQEVVTWEGFEVRRGMPGAGAFDPLSFGDAPIWFENSRSKTVILRDYFVSGTGYRNTPTGTGDLFIENTSAFTNYIFKYGQRVFGFAIDPEINNYSIINDGAILNVLGMKTEKEGTKIYTLNGGQTEVFGAFIYANSNEKVKRGGSTARPVDKDGNLIPFVAVDPLRPTMEELKAYDKLKVHSPLFSVTSGGKLFVSMVEQADLAPAGIYTDPLYPKHPFYQHYKVLVRGTRVVNGQDSTDEIKSRWYGNPCMMGRTGGSAMPFFVMKNDADHSSPYLQYETAPTLTTVAGSNVGEGLKSASVIQNTESVTLQPSPKPGIFSWTGMVLLEQEIYWFLQTPLQN